MANLSEIDSRYFIMVMGSEIGNVGLSDISATCPICNEGKSYGRKKRFHLYIKDSYDSANVKCFNCDYSSNMYGFLKEYHPREFQLYQNEKRSSSLKSLKMTFKYEEEENQQPQKEDISNISSGLDFNTETPDILESKEKVENDGHEEKALSKEEIALFSSGLDFESSSTFSTTSKVKKVDVNEPVKDGDVFVIPPVQGFTKIPDEVLQYIKKRGIEPQENWLYSPNKNKVIFNKTSTTLSEFIIIPLAKGDKWYGFQALAWKHKQFFVYMVTGNSGHKHWNFYNIDKTKEVYVTESIYDSISCGKNNTMAILGSSLGSKSLQELEKPIFCLDNQHIDEKSKEESMKYLNMGYKVFIWPEKTPDSIKDFNDLRKRNVPYEKIANMIDKNIYSGISGKVRLALV